MPTVKISRAIARKVLTVVDAGLCSGLGSGDKGNVCVEQAVSIALGLPSHSDTPPCVGPAVRSFKVALNDARWSSRQARAKGLRRIAVAQLGSNEIDQVEFAKLLALRCIQKLVPAMLRTVAELVPSPHKTTLLDHARKCEEAEDLNAASHAASYAARAASYASYAAGDAASSAASSAARAASYASHAASYAASSASYAGDAASAARAAASYASYAASAATSYAGDKVLSEMADIGVAVLQELKSPGCEWLDLTEETEAA